MSSFNQWLGDHTHFSPDLADQVTLDGDVMVPVFTIAALLKHFEFSPEHKSWFGSVPGTTVKERHHCCYESPL